MVGRLGRRADLWDCAEACWAIGAAEVAMTRKELARRRIEERIYNSAVGAPAESKWRGLINLITEHGFASRIARKRLGLPTWLNTEDRRVLEAIILEHYRSEPTPKTVLFVGCDFYTANYESAYFAKDNFWTIDPAPACRKHGAKQHLITPLEKLNKHFPAGFFNLIICNGVFGWGLDTLEQCDAAFSHCHTCLASRGRFLLGWDNIPERTPIPLESIPSLAKFRGHPFPPLGTWRYVTHTPYRHIYDFYQKNEPGPKRNGAG
jgi:hypothetical protein